MDPAAHRKIELDSPEDLRYLYNRLLQLSKQKLDAHFPSSDSTTAVTNGTTPTTITTTPTIRKGSEVIKRDAEQLITDYLLHLFELAGKSISINGLDFMDSNSVLKKGPVEEYEPYDRRLHDRLQSLHAQLADETVRVSELRRSVPVKVASRYQKALEKELEKDEKIITIALAAERDVEIIREDREELHRSLERQEQIMRDYQRDMDILQRLRTTFPTTISKITRAQEAADYIASKQPK